MAENEQTGSMKERLSRLKARAALQRLRGVAKPRLGTAGWLALTLILAVPALMMWGAQEDTVELEPLVVLLYSERGMEPPPAPEKKMRTLPEGWQERFQPRHKEYPVKHLSRKADTQYRQVDRYEVLPRVLEAAPRRKLTVQEDRPVPDTTRIHEKDLVLAGRGYEIGRFQRHPGLGLQLNTLPLPEAQTVPLSELPDYGRRSVEPGEDVVNRLIFHSGATGIPPQVTLEDPMKPPPPASEEEPVTTRPLPETRLVLKVDHESLLLLNPGPEKPVDLLNGHPAINRHMLEQRERRGR